MARNQPTFAQAVFLAVLIALGVSFGYNLHAVYSGQEITPLTGALAFGLTVYFLLGGENPLRRRRDWRPIDRESCKRSYLDHDDRGRFIDGS